MKKICKSFCLLTALFLLITAGHATTVLIPERQGAPGSLVRVDIAVEGADSLAGAELHLQYDKSFLEFKEVDRESGLHEFHIESKENNSHDQIALAMARPTALDKNYAYVCKLVFRIRESVAIGSATEISFISSKLYSDSTRLIPHVARPGVVRAVDVACYPNPFTPDGNGINDAVQFLLPENLMPNSQVKIFGLAGNLIREIQAAGYDFLQWDGKDANGHLAKPGVYLFLLLHNGEPLRKGTITLML